MRERGHRQAGERSIVERDAGHVEQPLGRGVAGHGVVIAGHQGDLEAGPHLLAVGAAGIPEGLRRLLPGVDQGHVREHGRRGEVGLILVEVDAVEGFGRREGLADRGQDVPFSAHGVALPDRPVTARAVVATAVTVTVVVLASSPVAL